jgi:hypothetical protein
MWAEGRMRSGEPEAVAWLARSLAWVGEGVGACVVDAEPCAG